MCICFYGLSGSKLGGEIALDDVKVEPLSRCKSILVH